MLQLKCLFNHSVLFRIRGFIVLGKDYTKDSLVKEFKKISKTHDLRLQNGQGRWELYCKFILLLRRGDLKKVDVDSDKLEVLHLSRNKLSQILKFVQDGPLPVQCPPPFRTGRSPEIQLTQTERQALLDYITYMCRCGQALNVAQCKLLTSNWRPTRLFILVQLVPPSIS